MLAVFSKTKELIITTLLILAVISTSFAQGKIYVNAAATSGANNGSSWANAYTNFQAGVNAAASGDSVFVAKGVYLPALNSSFSMKAGVKIYGGFEGTEASLAARNLTANLTDGDTSILKGNGNSVVYNNNNSLDTTARLDGFTLTGGNTDLGGGMYNSSSSPTVTNCTFSGNTASFEGGGMCNFSSSPTIVNCTFSGDTAASNGGGMYNSSSSPTIINCTFSGDTTAYNGAGMFNDASSPTVINCTFSENKTPNTCGGMYNNNSSSPTVTNCTFSENMATVGGGMYNSSSSPTVTNCTFSGNVATNGGGMYNFSSSSSPTVTNCTFSGNAATLGGGMFSYGSSPTITNTIIYGNGTFNYSSNSGTPVITYSLVQGMGANAANHNLAGSTDPLFVSSTNLNLQNNSPCINAGNNNSLPAGDTLDLAGNSRIFGGTVDMGAYELQSNSSLPIVLIDYTARADGPHRVKLNWTTAQEYNNKEFMVFHSTDGKHFEELGSVPAADNSDPSQSYVLYDLNPSNGLNFYRLQQTDYDNQTTQLGIRFVNLSIPKENRISVYPNPVTDQLQVQFNAGQFNKLILTDMNGKVLQQIPLGSSDNQKEVILGNLPSGSYVITLEGNNRAESEMVIKE